VVGDTISGSYTFDSTAPDLDSSPVDSSYQTIISLNFVTSRGYSASAIGSPTKGLIETQNDSPNLTKDRYVVNMEAPGQTISAPAVDGQTLTFLTIVLRSSLTTVFPSDALPLTPPSIGDFDRGRELFLGFNNVERVIASVTSLTAASSDPKAKIGFLKGDVELLEGAGTLNEGLSMALLAKLDGALKQAERQPRAATNMLESFIQQVRALVGRGTLSSAEGQSLTAAAQEIIDSLTLQP
jgi:hypothetical protein